MTTLTFGQSLSDKYLHYTGHYYWDTILYESEQLYYYEVTSGKITQKEYPVLQYLFTRIISDSPLVKIDTFERRGWSHYPYKYIRKHNNIYLQYFDLGKKKLRLNKEYSLNRNDTVEGLADKNSLDSKDGISVGGFSVYLGEETIDINSNRFRTFHFLEDHYQWSSHPSYFTREVYLDHQTLIPIKFVTRQYDFKSRRKLLYNSVTILTSSSNYLADYTNKTTEDLILYENKNTIWSQQQKETFINMFPPRLKQYAECLLKKLDGHISFFRFKQNWYYQNLLVRRVCE